MKQREFFTAEEAAGWKVHGNETVIFRGGTALDTGPVAELGRALSALLRGVLPAPPPGTMWLYGWPGGRTALTVANPQASLRTAYPTADDVRSSSHVRKPAPGITLR